MAKGFWGFRISDVVMIFAVLVAPLLALQAQWLLQLRREKRQRKLWLFKTLMSTRGTRLAPDHVTALNSIEVEFHKETGANREVVAAWRNYLDHLNTSPPINQETGQVEPTEHNRWNEKQDELFISLLYRMALALDYDFDEVLLKRGFYAPKGHNDLELDQLLLRKGLLQVLGGTRAVGVNLMPVPGEEDEQTRLRQLTLKYLEGRTPMPVVLSNAEDRTADRGAETATQSDE